MPKITHFHYVFTLLLICLGVAISGCARPSASMYTSTPVAAPTVQPTQNSLPIPVTPTAIPTPVIGPRLIIPAIGVNAPIEPVWVIPSGILGVPTQNPWEAVGLYKSGPYPGQRGSAVIDGHLDRPGAYPAVFWRLHELQVGNIVEFVDATGKTLYFRVRAKRSYAPQNAPLNTIFGDTSGTYLNLITCAGQWLPTERQTSLRLVIYTVLV